MKLNKTETQAVILNKYKQAVALISTFAANRSDVIYSTERCLEQIDASREYNLVNAKVGKISRAKKYMNNKQLIYDLERMQEKREMYFIFR